MGCSGSAGDSASRHTCNACHVSAKSAHPGQVGCQSRLHRCMVCGATCMLTHVLAVSVGRNRLHISSTHTMLQQLMSEPQVLILSFLSVARVKIEPGSITLPRPLSCTPLHRPTCGTAQGKPISRKSSPEAPVDPHSRLAEAPPLTQQLPGACQWQRTAPAGCLEVCRPCAGQPALLWQPPCSRCEPRTGLCPHAPAHHCCFRYGRDR